MCGPQAVIGSMAGGSIMSAVGSYNQAQGQKTAYAYQAAVDQENVTIAQEQAKQALAVGAQEEQSQELKNAQTFGNQRASMAANGIDLSSSGTATDILASTKYLGQRDVLTLHDNALRQAWGYNVQATSAQNSANFMKYASSQINPASAAFGSLLQSGGQVASKWYDFNKAGVDIL